MLNFIPRCVDRPRRLSGRMVTWFWVVGIVGSVGCAFFG